MEAFVISIFWKSEILVLININKDEDNTDCEVNNKVGKKKLDCIYAFNLFVRLNTIKYEVFLLVPPPHKRLSNNRSVMPLDVLGCTRATMRPST
jgi:hypothetical protein